MQPLVMLSQQQIPTTSLFYQALLKTVVTFVVKTRGDIPVAQQMRTVFHQLAPGFALDQFQTMQEAVDKNTFSQRLGLYLVGSFAGLAIAMVIAGLYGVLSQLVSYRRREIGVRMALGATRGSVATLVLRQGSILIGAGLVAGLAAGGCDGAVDQGFPVRGEAAGCEHVRRGCGRADGDRIGGCIDTGAESCVNPADAGAAG